MTDDDRHAEVRTIGAIVPRSSREEITFAVAEAQVDAHFADEQANEVHELFAALQQCITDWSRETSTGRDVVRSRYGRFNAGDLAEWCGEDSLMPYLAQAGIRRLSVTVYSNSNRHCWEFDDDLLAGDEGSERTE